MNECRINEFNCYRDASGVTELRKYTGFRVIRHRTLKKSSYLQLSTLIMRNRVSFTLRFLITIYQQQEIDEKTFERSPYEIVYMNKHFYDYDHVCIWDLFPLKSICLFFLMYRNWNIFVYFFIWKLSKNIFFSLFQYNDSGIVSNDLSVF